MTNRAQRTSELTYIGSLGATTRMADSTEQPPVLPRSRNRLIWLFIALGLVLLLPLPTFFVIRSFLGSSDSTEPTPVASFRGDFLPEHPRPGWRYFWNPNGPVGDTNGYVELVWNGAVYATTAAEVPRSPPAHYLRISSTGGHPGQGPSQTASRGIDYEHTVIIAFTVSDSGHFAIGPSSLSRHAGAKHGSVRLQVFLNDRDTGSEVYCRSREGISFDRRLGHLSRGDTIYVIIGPGETDVNDHFDLDFTIGRL